MLLKNITEVKKYLGRAVNKADGGAGDNFLEPFIRLAQDEFIAAAISPELLAEIDVQYNAEPVALTPANKRLLPLLQLALAFYAYWKYLPYSLGNDGYNGLQEEKTEGSQPVRIGVLEKRQQESIDNASAGIEVALNYLYAHADDYPTWQASAHYARSQAMLIRTATQLGQLLPHSNGSYRLFLALRPYLERAESETIAPLLGHDQWDDLKHPTDPQTQQLAIVAGKALAAVAYRDALFHLNVVKNAAGGLRVLSEFDGIHNAKAPDERVIQQARQMATDEAERYLNALIRFLKVHAADYPLYRADPASQRSNPFQAPDNEKYNAIFRLK